MVLFTLSDAHSNGTVAAAVRSRLLDGCAGLLEGCARACLQEGCAKFRNSTCLIHFKGVKYRKLCLFAHSKNMAEKV